MAMSNFHVDETFDLSEIAAMPRGMTLEEAQRYLMTDELPDDDPFKDISLSTSVEDQRAQRDEDHAQEEFDDGGLSDAEVDAFLSGENSITAAISAADGITAGIFKKHHDVGNDHYDPSQPRDAHGQWTRTGASAISGRLHNAVRGADVFKSPTLTLTSDNNDRQHDALRTYASQQYTLINSALRYAKKNNKSPENLKADFRDVIHDIDGEMARSTLKDDIVVYRGIKTPEDAFGSAWNDQPGSMIGVEYSDPHYSSTSTSPNIAMDFSEIIRTNYERDRKDRIKGVKRERTSGVQLRILVPKGSHAVGLTLHGEGEILLPRDTHFRIVGDHVVDGDRLLDVEVIS